MTWPNAFAAVFVTVAILALPVLALPVALIWIIQKGDRR